MESVAALLSAVWETGDDSADAYITVAGERVAVDIATLKQRATSQGKAPKPRLRFDKVVTRLLEQLQVDIGNAVPDGITVLLTVTAPIRLPSKTAAALEDKIKTLLRHPPRRDEKDTIHGNQVHIRLLRNASEGAPKLIGFVHNSSTDPLLLLRMTGDLLELPGRRATRFAGQRWLVVISAAASSCLETYRYIYSQLSPSTGFTKILMVFGDDRADMLT